MADFCYDCAPKLFPAKPEENDFNVASRWPSLDPKTHYLDNLCEGCGPGTFNLLGQRVNEKGEHTPAEPSSELVL